MNARQRNRACVLILAVMVPKTVLPQALGTVRGTIVNARTTDTLPNVTVRVVGRSRIVYSGADGRYELRLPPGAYELQAGSIGFAATRATVFVTENVVTLQDFALERSAVPLDEVVTVGTRSVDRTSAQSAAPVDVVSEYLLRSTGFVETWQALQRIIPSVNSPHVPLGDDHMRAVTLRGLAPEHVLVLVNGKRQHSAATVHGGPVLNGSVPVDLNAIPTNAIDRIEVLRDGAAAQYGSDAIGGVVNVVLKSGKRNQASTTVSQAYTTEGGRTWHDGELLNVNAAYGTVFPRGAQITVATEYRNRQRTNRAYPDQRTQYFVGDPRNANPPRISSEEGDGHARDAGVLVNVSLPVKNSVEAYSFGSLTNRRAESGAAGFRRANDTRTIRSLYPDGFLPQIRSSIFDFSAGLGIRGIQRGWRWDLSSAIGGNSVRYNVFNSNNVTLGNESPTEFYAGTLRSQEWVTNFDASTQRTFGRLQPIRIAFGAEVRADRYSIFAGEPDSYRDGGVLILDGDSAGKKGAVGSQGMVGFRPIDEARARRSNVAAYLDLENRPVRWLLLDIAGRIERYDDFGSTSDGRVAARLELSDAVALRGSIGTGFRAPSLTQTYLSTTRGIIRNINGVVTPFTIRTLPVNSEEAQILGATPLRPETSVNVSGGIVLDIAEAVRVTADYYAVDLDDRIVLSGEFTAPAIAQLFEQHGLRGIAGGRYFTNAIDTKTRGLDIVANYGLFFGKGGSLSLTGAFNQTKTRVTRITSAPPQLSAFQSVLFNRAERGKIEVGQPRQTIITSANYRVDRFALNLHNQRFGQAFLLDLSDPKKDQRVTAKWITDLGISYEITPRVSLSATANNVFDVYPDEWIDFKDGVAAQGMSMSGIFRYPGGISPFGMNGRTINVRLAYR